MPINSVAIVGAGPSGLLLSLLLVRLTTIPRIIVLERDASPTDETRAVFYQHVAFHEFKRAGIFEVVEKAAFRPRKVAWRDLKGNSLLEMPGAGAGMMALTMDKLARVVQSEVEKSDRVEIKWSHTVRTFGEKEDGRAWLDVETPQGLTKFDADYVVGCDGGSSTIRRGLFGEKSLPGFTWDKELVAADVEYTFPESLEISDSNLFMDEAKAWLLFRPSQDENHWRVIYTKSPDVQEEDVVSSGPAAIQSLLPGNPSSEQFKIKRIRPYRIHQRLVESMRKGRFVLASDAAHLTCPYGALGLNGGIADIGSLADCLHAIHEGRADDSILDVYSDVRREKWKTIIDPTSQRTLKMIFSDPKKTIPMMKANAGKGGAQDPLALRYDFSPHFKAA